MKLILVLLLFVLNSCKISSRDKTETLFQRLTWDGQLANIYSIDSLNPINAHPDSSSRILASRRHHFEFIGKDTTRLVLHEFDQEYLAFATFGKRANSNELKEGFYRDRNALFFYHGRFLAEISYTHIGLIPAHFLISKLVFKGEDLFLRPREFESFPLFDQIPKSERVVLTDFLGKKWQSPVFTMQYQCHEDTATAFRTLTQSPDYGFSFLQNWQGKLDTLLNKGEMRFTGQNEMAEPVIFWVHQAGIIGLVGCYDPNLALGYTEKMRKMVILWSKP